MSMEPILCEYFRHCIIALIRGNVAKDVIKTNEKRLIAAKEEYFTSIEKAFFHSKN